MADPKNPKPGDLHIDASDVDMMDLTPEEMLRATKVREGLAGAVQSLLRLSPADVQQLGLNATDIKSLGEHYLGLVRTEQLLPAAQKLAELIAETRAHRGHQINLLLGEMANQARRRGERDAKGSPLLGQLTELMDYQFGPAEKAAATKKKAKKPETK